MKVLAVYNIKGGVGKTSTAVNLAYLSARDGYRTLLWDLDPQGSATLMLEAKPRARGGLRTLIRARKGLDDAICDTQYDKLSVIPAEFADRKIDAVFGTERAPRRRITRLLAPLEKQFDVVILDCPPSVSLISENIMVAADTLIVPLIPTTLSVHTFGQLTEFVTEFGDGRPSVFAFLSMVDRRKRLHLDILQEMQTTKRNVANTAIPALSVIEQMAMRRAPVPAFAPRSGAAWCYEELWSEVVRRAKLRRSRRKT